MGEELSNTMNQDLNLHPDPELVLEPATNNSAVNYSPWANRRFPRAIPLSQFMLWPAERLSEYSKKCENGNGVMEEESVREEKRVTEKSNGSDGSFFDCCICLELSKDPVVTNCGHLYCWSCLYQWLEVSYAKECPVCKGEISVETLTPIYGHGGNKEVSDTKIPSRPQARRTESLRNSLNRSTETDRQRRLEREYDRAEREVGYLQSRLERESNTHRYLLERESNTLDRYLLERELGTGGRQARPFPNRVMTLSGVRAEQNQPSAALVAPVDETDLLSDIVTVQEAENRNLIRPSRALSIQRETQSERPVSMLPISTALSNTERLVNVMLERNTEQNNNPPSLVEHRVLFSRLGVLRSGIEFSTTSFERRHENGSSML